MSVDGAGYVHGYSREEQRRLVDQSLYLEPWVFERIRYEGRRRLIEVGCGVGAQLRILARRFPRLHLTGVDRSETQLAAARAVLAGELQEARVELMHADGTALPFAPGSFDAAFLCWVLEHAPEPDALLQGLRRVLEPNATLYATEVFNASLFVSPECAGIKEFWALLNARQQELAGDPFVGVKLGNLLDRAGFKDVKTWPVVFHLDRRWRDAAQRKEFFEYWRVLFHSAVPGLIEAGRATPALSEAIDRDFARLTQAPDAVFYVTAFQAVAKS
jgi:SAM-dependent methyltransferase